MSKSASSITMDFVLCTTSLWYSSWLTGKKDYDISSIYSTFLSNVKNIRLYFPAYRYPYVVECLKSNLLTNSTPKNIDNSLKYGFGGDRLSQQSFNGLQPSDISFPTAAGSSTSSLESSTNSTATVARQPSVRRLLGASTSSLQPSSPSSMQCIRSAPVGIHKRFSYFLYSISSLL